MSDDVVITEQDAIRALMELAHDAFPAQDERTGLARDGALATWAEAKRGDYPQDLNWPHVVASFVFAEDMPLDIEKMIATMRKHLADGTGYVKINTPPPLSGTTVAVAHMLADLRKQTIDRGDRVAYLYTHAFNAKHPWAKEGRYALACTVTNEQALELIAAGAEWIGNDFYKPRPR